MPYLDCHDCHLTVYSAAKWSHIDECPQCGAPLGLPLGPFTTDLPARIPQGGQTPPQPRRPAAGIRQFPT